eukprot:TRINITY_DN3659_c0_g1_i1.p1 TRINITY_DN3659_c0_g1~~TRINITY_DN3659_c0_g1_i1.p1  ORF type:complete len:179 (-),score=17.14 TRINITY_DN3659_c0_g1_i1:238-750(-)
MKNISVKGKVLTPGNEETTTDGLGKSEHNDHEFLTLDEESICQTPQSKLEYLRKWLKTFFPNLPLSLQYDYTNLQEVLADGTILCNLINKIKPFTITNFNQIVENDKFNVKAKQNIDLFLNACKTEFYMEDLLLFSSSHVFDTKTTDSMKIVVEGLDNLRRLVEATKTLL